MYGCLFGRGTEKEREERALLDPDPSMHVWHLFGRGAEKKEGESRAGNVISPLTSKKGCQQLVRASYTEKKGGNLESSKGKVEIGGHMGAYSQVCSAMMCLKQIPFWTLVFK